MEKCNDHRWDAAFGVTWDVAFEVVTAGYIRRERERERERERVLDLYWETNNLFDLYTIVGVDLHGSFATCHINASSAF